MNRLRQMIKDCPYENKGCVPGDCVLCSEAPRGIRRECLEIIKQGVAAQIFKELENLIPMFYINHVQDYLAIKSKFLEGE